VKDRTNDLDTMRKSREEKATQIRKEKRSDRTNIERRKVIGISSSLSHGDK
jgi:hypothetical protein